MIVTGGGTGGHLFPGIALAEEVLHKLPGSEVLFVGTGRMIDNKVLAARKFASETLNCHGLKGKSWLEVLRALVQLPISLIQAAMIIRRFNPDVVVGVGGYVTGPVILMARLMGKATCIHEQNSVPGLANRMLGKIADRIFLSINGSESYFPVGKYVFTGNPVRAEFVNITRDIKKVKAAGSTLLVLGGSQGAHRVNSLVSGALEKYKSELPNDFMVIHQTGKKDEEMVRRQYSQAGIKAKVSSFIDDMVGAYQLADLVVSRAGATSLAEITVMHKPSILIPYPYAADNHQEKNALQLVKVGGAIMFLENELNEDLLGRKIVSLFSDYGARQEMSDKAGSMARPQAVSVIMEECLQLAAA
ncbi:MAG: undecaprenyldiphospho-muramoylpentapeptide beta-N-acetylglucosaminyltransferase [Proteobacteria bacterium]|nr:undecaprenyldiphospho-muramoylpentapeptide beta-N-acetylglucosaminyltransferase [Pseudomonadota bacterium]MBU1717332.1 undecaprenyldiphospho-muramoylpentapeptide beta-N-acetylglucosaminyltransferase [Pseudomonadota bacterium]